MKLTTTLNKIIEHNPSAEYRLKLTEQFGNTFDCNAEINLLDIAGAIDLEFMFWCMRAIDQDIQVAVGNIALKCCDLMFQTISEQKNVIDFLPEFYNDAKNVVKGDSTKSLTTDINSVYKTINNTGDIALRISEAATASTYHCLCAIGTSHENKNDYMAIHHLHYGVKYAIAAGMARCGHHNSEPIAAFHVILSSVITSLFSD